MQPHPEVDQTNMIGWQPVFATNRPPTTSGNQNLMLIVGVLSAAVLIASAGGILFKQHQDMNAQKAIWQQQAANEERSRIIECITPK